MLLNDFRLGNVYKVPPHLSRLEKAIMNADRDENKFFNFNCRGLVVSNIVKALTCIKSFSNASIINKNLQ
jgi:hypothetical protein